MSNDKTTSVKYDKENDILYISFGPPRPSYCIKEIDDVFIMKGIESKEYSGVTILGFLERVKAGSLLSLELPFP